MFFLKQSTAYTLKIGPFLDSIDGDTEEGALAIAQADVRLSKNGGNYAQKNDANAAVYDETGMYACELDATDTNTLGRLQVNVHVAGALSVWHEFHIVPANVYDSLIAGSDYLETDTVAISGDSGAADNAELDYDGTGYAKANSTIGTCTTNTDMRGTDGASTHSAADVTDDWETQSQADPTGFHVNVMEVNGTGQTANDNGADINAILQDTGTDGVLLAATATSAQLVDDVWDEALTGATHNVPTSSGRRLRNLGAFALLDGTATAGTANSITLDGDAEAIAGYYNRDIVVIVGGTGAGQSRTIGSYSAARVATTTRDWITNPDNTSDYQILAFSLTEVINQGIAQAGANDSITLAASACADNDKYVDCQVVIDTGAGHCQSRLITAYVGATRVATVSPDWVINPDNTSVYQVRPGSRTNVGQIEGADPTDQIGDAVWDEAIAAHVGAGSAGEAQKFTFDIEGGRWRILFNAPNWQQVFYEDDNVTEVARFNLLDAAGNPADPTTTAIAERVRV